MPSMTVKNNLCKDWFKFEFMILWWVHVTVIPEDNKIIVLSNGISNGLKVLTPNGGQIRPISIVGDKLLWKKAQKKDIKNKTSEVINRIIPIFILFITIIVWSPWNVLSRVTSRHHW